MITKTEIVIEYNTEILLSRLIFRDAEPEQLEFIRRYYMERWQNEQREDVHRMVEEAKDHIDESGFATKADWIPNKVWLRWVERYICDRFQYMLRWEWVEAFAMLDDETLFVRHKNGVEGDKEALYLKFVRDYARRYVNEQ